MIAQHLYSAQF